MATTLDTHREVKNLVGAGLEESHAEAVVETVMGARAGLATTTHLDLIRAGIRADLRELKLDLIKWHAGITIATCGIAVGVLSLILG